MALDWISYRFAGVPNTTSVQLTSQAEIWNLHDDTFLPAAANQNVPGSHVSMNNLRREEEKQEEAVEEEEERHKVKPHRRWRVLFLQPELH